MKINITKEQIDGLQLFVSQVKTREQLHGVNIKEQDGKIVFAATDGGRLLVIERKKKEGESVPEGGVSLKFPKLPKKLLNLTIEEQGGMFVLKTPDGSSVGLLEQIKGTFPNYSIVLEQEQNAKPVEEYIYFKWDYMRDMEKCGFDMTITPKGTGHNRPYFWEREENGVRYKVAMMSAR